MQKGGVGEVWGDGDRKVKRIGRFLQWCCC